MGNDTRESNFVRHEPCPSCGSRDNLGRFSDGHGWCFGCGHYEKGEGEERMTARREPGELLLGSHEALSGRRLSEETTRKFDYRVTEYHGKPAHAATYYTPDGIAVAQKVRLPGKDFVWIGEPKKAGLYGQHLWQSGGRKVVVTEGELDALSVSQVQGNKWPVVSVPNGAQGAAAALRKQLDWLESFAEIILMFDMDDPGRAASRECAELFTPGKARIAELPRKDASDMLQAGEVKELASAVWQAKVYRPDGIVAGVELWDLLRHEDATPAIPYPWSDLQELTHGMRLGEIVTWCAGTGIGKSTVCRELAYHLVMMGETVGYVALEESVRRTALGFLSIHLGRPLHLGYGGDLPEEKLQEAFTATLGSNRVFLYDHWGSLEGDNLFLKMRQMVRGCGVKWIVLDHVSIVVSGLETPNERKELDVVMTKLRSLAEELNVGILVVSHLRRKEGKAHEDGGKVSLADLRGTQAIAHLSDLVVGLERNQQASADERDVAQLRVLKNRFSGDTGPAGFLRYDKQTGRLRSDEGGYGDGERWPADEAGAVAGGAEGSDSARADF